MIDIALNQQDRNKPFQPFVLLEDDVSKNREFPNNIIVPDDTDILYIGISICSFNGYSHTINNYYKNINDDIIQIFNMLSTHGMIVCSCRGALLLQKVMFEAHFLNIDYDFPIARSQIYYNIYAFKNPLVYQDKEYNGSEKDTKFIIKTDDIDNPIPSNFIDTNSLCVITCYNYNKFLT